MIQDIFPDIYHVEYSLKRNPKPEDRIIIYRNNQLLLHREGDVISFPTWREWEASGQTGQLQYLFSIGETAFFTDLYSVIEEFCGFGFENYRNCRHGEPVTQAFAAGLAGHLSRWYQDNRYCGRCGREMVHHSRERAMICMECGKISYPKIAPAVIVGVTDGDRILLTKYSRGSYRKYALIAGYNEIGETLEDTVRREVFEEVGLRVKNIRYYKSQPWMLDDTILAGYFAELDGDSTISLEEDELAEATWYSREKMPEVDRKRSLTNEMMDVFRSGMLPD